MAEPNNTPYPPSTPLAATPRSASPAPPVPVLSTIPDSTDSIQETDPDRPTDEAEAMPLGPFGRPKTRPVVLHIGDPIKYNPATYEILSSAFEVVRPSAEERQRPEFIRALKEQRWGDFDAIFRPFWGTGGEMGKWDAELISLLPRTVKVFASAGAGFDWADTKLLGEKGVIYCNGGLAAAEAVADFAVFLIISTFRQLPWCINAATLPYLSNPAVPDETRGGIFHACHDQATKFAHNLRGHTLGLIGFGNIGQQIATKMRLAFGMKIAYHDVIRKPAAVEAEQGATFYATLAELMRASDCVVLATPASPDGRPLIRTDTLAGMRPGTRFVNIARGSLVDEDALADALEKGLVGSAALDVHATEPRVNPRLLKFAGLDTHGAHPGRVMLTTHNAGGTVETHIGFEELGMRNILNVLQGKDAITPVNLHFLSNKSRI